MNTWETIGRPGYLGKNRDRRSAEWNATYGPGKWRLAWKIGPTFADFLGACALYEDAYFTFLQARPDVLTRLLVVASDVYDDNPANVQSGFDYAHQQTRRTHVQDVAIRRAVLRHGRWFQGDALIQIRDVEPHGLTPVAPAGAAPAGAGRNPSEAFAPLRPPGLVGHPPVFLPVLTHGASGEGG